MPAYSENVSTGDRSPPSETDDRALNRFLAGDVGEKENARVVFVRSNSSVRVAAVQTALETGNADAVATMAGSLTPWEAERLVSLLPSMHIRPAAFPAVDQFGVSVALSAEQARRILRVFGSPETAIPRTTERARWAEGAAPVVPVFGFDQSGSMAGGGAASAASGSPGADRPPAEPVTAPAEQVFAGLFAGIPDSPKGLGFSKVSRIDIADHGVGGVLRTSSGPEARSASPQSGVIELLQALESGQAQSVQRLVAGLNPQEIDSVISRIPGLGIRPSAFAALDQLGASSRVSVEQAQRLTAGFADPHLHVPQTFARVREQSIAPPARPSLAEARAAREGQGENWAHERHHVRASAAREERDRNGPSPDYKGFAGITRPEKGSPDEAYRRYLTMGTIPAGPEVESFPGAGNSRHKP